MPPVDDTMSPPMTPPELGGPPLPHPRPEVEDAINSIRQTLEATGDIKPHAQTLSAQLLSQLPPSGPPQSQAPPSQAPPSQPPISQAPLGQPQRSDVSETFMVPPSSLVEAVPEPLDSLEDPPDLDDDDALDLGDSLDLGDDLEDLDDE